MLRKWFFNLAYYQRPIWDTGISPPELLDFIAAHKPGRALDMGCGTGTNVITLAKSGWRVSGVDFAWRAIQIAKKKARQSNVTVDLFFDDVTRLTRMTGHFDLILDIGCFHALPISSHNKYITNVNRLLAPGGSYLLYVFFTDPSSIPGPGVTEESINKLLQTFKLIERNDGTERSLRPSAWLTLQKYPS
jgi:cyclopropane fatty-acyl-phospholipid synthase-like methyltransferase